MKDKNIEYIAKLSPVQQGMLFHTVYGPASGVYFLQFSCTLHGELNHDAFERAWRRIVERHAILRTAFYWEQVDKPLQVAYRQVALPWTYLDWRDLPQEEHQPRLAELLHEDRTQGVQFSRAPAMRWTLIRRAEDDYYFLWSYHHILLDGWCQSLLLREIFACYHAFCQHQDIHLPDVRPYRDYIAWLQEQDEAAAERFWRQSLCGFTAPTPLPPGHPSNTAGDTTDYGEQQLTLSPATAQALQTLARQNNLTLNTLIQGAWALLLSRYSGSDDIVFGVAVSGRPATLAGSESMIGMFINTLPIRVRLPADMPVLRWLNILQQQQQELQQYEYSSLVQIQGWSEVPRGRPLFESILIFKNYPAAEATPVAERRLEMRNVQSAEQTHYLLTLTVLPAQSLALQLNYQHLRFGDDAIVAILEQLRTVLEGFTADPTQPLWAAPVLTATQRQQMLVTWNATELSVPANQHVYGLFEAQACRAPDTVAITFGDQHLTYYALRQRSYQLADYLGSLGVGPEVRVGICLERSAAMVVGLLGILRAGGAYVPLDPALPPERLALMVDDAQLSVLLTQYLLCDRLPQHHVKTVCLDSDHVAIFTNQLAHHERLTLPEHLAYVIYTSGSTGRPKGVQVPHRALTNFLYAMQRQLGLTDQDALLAVTTLSFDIAGLELFVPLTIGARVVLASQEVASDGARLAELLSSSGATCMQATPVTWQMLLDTGWPGDPRLLLLCGGESLPRELARRLRACGRGLWNLYGPTETTIWSTASPLPTIDDLDAGPVPIGRPIHNTQIYLLDRALQPVPVGVPGELYIGGHGVVRGYLRRPDLTAERFVPNPFADERRTTNDERPTDHRPPTTDHRRPGDQETRGQGDEERWQSPISTLQSLNSLTQNSKLNTQHSRLYKTGDLARYLPDGTLTYLGRSDYQVKLRGYRIELEEIEHGLAHHPQVRACVVLAREDVVGDKRLVAYIVPSNEFESNGDSSLVTRHSSLITELRAFLKQKLPQYMLPSALVVLDAFPQTPNGKIDRTALPAPAGLRPELEKPFVAPRTALEERIAGIWMTILKLERVGIRDNFFDLGGHSLLALQVLARLREAFQVNIGLRHLFEAPTIEQLAQVITIIQEVGPEALADLFSSPDLSVDAQLDPAISAAGRQYTFVPTPASVFLTGATGYVGAFLLYELLQQTGATIYCLVRSKSCEEGWKRIKATLESYALWDAAFQPRIVPVAGDLSAPLLGLSPAQFQELADTIDVIYHNAALVNFVYPYSVMKAPNVLGTQEVLRLAVRSRLKPVHFMSTANVFFSAQYAAAEVVHEWDTLDDPIGLRNGYAQSKWVAEKLIMAARARGVPVCIYRSGRVGWDSQTGIWNANDLLYQFINGCWQLGSAPRLNYQLEIIPIDYLSKATIYLSLQARSLGSCFHLVNPHTVDWMTICDWICSADRSVRAIDWAAWAAEMQAATSSSTDHALQGIKALDDQGMQVGIQRNGRLRFDAHNTLQGLAGTSIACPAVDEALFRPFLAQLLGREVPEAVADL